MRLHLLERHIVFHYLNINIVIMFFITLIIIRFVFVFNHSSLLDICSCNFIVLPHQLLFHSTAIYLHLSLPCVTPPVQLSTRLHNKAIKLCPCDIKLQAPPIKRARAHASALVKLGHQLCAGEHASQLTSVEDFTSSQGDILSWVLSWTSNPSCKL